MIMEKELPANHDIAVLLAQKNAMERPFVQLSHGSRLFTVARGWESAVLKHDEKTAPCGTLLELEAALRDPGKPVVFVPADALICGDERAVMADAAYHSHAREAALKARGIKPRLMRRPNKHHPKLPPRLQRYNRLIARRRAAVETTFATLKRRMGLHCIRYRGLAKATGQVIIAAIAFNMRKWVTLTQT